jgi:HSP20 family protein
LSQGSDELVAAAGQRDADGPSGGICMVLMESGLWDRCALAFRLHPLRMQLPPGKVAGVGQLRREGSGETDAGLARNCFGRSVSPYQKTMNVLTQWNPLREMQELQHRVLNALNVSPARGDNGDRESLATAEWVPVVDIVEDDKEYLIKAELPEVLKENVRVTVENGRLTLSGERKFEKEETGKKYHRVERSYGSFLRSFNLPENADAEKVEADFKDGVLRVHLPKQEKAKPREIEVKID